MVDFPQGQSMGLPGHYLRFVNQLSLVALGRAFINLGSTRSSYGQYLAGRASEEVRSPCTLLPDQYELANHGFLLGS